jgi:hypothetical protein
MTTHNFTSSWHGASQTNNRIRYSLDSDGNDARIVERMEAPFIHTIDVTFYSETSFFAVTVERSFDSGIVTLTI